MTENTRTSHVARPMRFHQRLFDARTGKALATPARAKLRMIGARQIDGTGQVLI